MSLPVQMSVFPSFESILGVLMFGGRTQMFLGLERAHFLSPTGQCKPWDASADGYSRAEGATSYLKISSSFANIDLDF